MAIKKCELCGKEFETSGNGKVCRDCRRGPCSICGKDIEYSQYQLRQLMGGKQVSCSDKCRAELTKRNLMKREGVENVSQRKSQRSNGFKRTCLLCGKEFEGARNARFCQECKRVECPVCHKRFEPSAQRFSQYLKRGWLTCSAKCGSAMAKKHLLEEEGIENVSQRDGVREKLRQTRLNDSDETKENRSESLKVACSKSEVIAQRREMMIKGTGYGSNMENPEIHAKMLMAAQTPEAKVKRLETHAKNHGGASTPFQMPEVMGGIVNERNERRMGQVDAVRRYLAEHSDATPRKICRELGIKYHALLQYNREFGLGIRLHHSGFEEEFRDCLLARGVDYEREYRMQVDGLNDRRNCPRYDFLIGDTLVEIDPWHYHNATYVDAWYEKDLEPHEPSYHLKKSRYAMEHEGKRCIHVFDWDDYEMVADMFVGREFANVCELSLETLDGTTAAIDGFLDKNHLQGACKGVRFASVLSSGGEIVSVMTFGRPRYNGKYDWELLRYCTRAGVAVRGGSRALWGAFRTANDGTVVSYCDNAKFGGRVYEKLGFELDDPGDTPHLHWYNPDTGRHFTAAYVNQLGVDKILGTDYGKGERNDALMLREGFVEIYDCGQSRWVFRRG